MPAIVLQQPPILMSPIASAKRQQIAVDARAQAASLDGVRKRLFELQAAVAEELPPVDCPLEHTFVDGVYVRTMHIPAGTVVVGKIHKYPHAAILSSGEISVMTEDGGLQRIRGPVTMVTPPGCKRAGFAHTDVVWTTIHRTNETDPDKVEDWATVQSYEEYDEFQRQEAAKLLRDAA